MDGTSTRQPEAGASGRRPSSRGFSSRRVRLLDLVARTASSLAEGEALRVRLACALVVDAYHGWPAAHRLDARALTVFELYHSRPAQVLRYLNVIAYMAVAFAETPGWCLDQRASRTAVCADEATFPRYLTFGFTPLASNVTAILESCCILLFALQLAFKAFFIGPRRFLRLVPNVLQTTLLGLTAMELVLWSSGLRRRTTISRPLRALFIVFAHRKLRDTGAAVLLMLPRVLELLFLITFLLAFSALVGFVLFAPWDPPITAYSTYGRSFYSSFLLLTETNFPGVALQPFRSSRPTMLFFVSFQLVLVFVGLALMLALLYRSYEAHMRTEAVALTRNRKRALAAAFAQLVHGWEEAGAEGALSSTLMPLSRFAPLLSRMRPDLNSWQVALCFEALDSGKRGVIDAQEFESVLCALHVKFECPPPVRAIRAHRLRLRARSLLRDWRVTVLLDGLVLVNAAVIGWEGHLAAPPVRNTTLAPGEHGSGPAEYGVDPWVGGSDGSSWPGMLAGVSAGAPALAVGISCTAQVGAQLPFILLWLGETGVKLWAYKFVLLGWNFFDAVLSLSGVLIMGAMLVTRCSATDGIPQMLRALLLLRLLRLLRLLALSPRFRLLLNTIIATARATLHFLWVLLIALFFYAAVGEEVLGGVWYEGAPCLAGTDYARLGYHVHNFNDLPTALVTCWVLTNINNFNIFMDAGYACLPGPVSSLFFGSFYVVVIFVVMNLLTSFILESVIHTFDQADARATGNSWTGAADALPGDLSAAPWQADEAHLTEAERFARACEERLRAEGNATTVCVRNEQADGYAALVGMLAGQARQGQASTTGGQHISSAALAQSSVSAIGERQQPEPPADPAPTQQSAQGYTNPTVNEGADREAS